MNGNIFASGTVSYGHKKEVWRSIKGVFPGGATLTSATLTQWKGKDVIPAGSAASINMKTKEVVVYTEAQVSGASDVKTLGINGFTQEDIVIGGAATKGATSVVATATVVYEGELYEFAIGEASLVKLKTLTSIPQIVFVY